MEQKLDEQGPNARYRAHVVAESGLLEEFVDYHETLDPVIPLDVPLLFVGNFTSFSRYVHHSDFSTVFLNENTYGDLYVR